MSLKSSRRSLLAAMGAGAIGITFSSCSKPSSSTSSASGEEPKLNLYNWDEYIGDTTLGDFKTATGIDVNMTLFASNDELFAKLKAGNPGYDVIVPTNDYVPRMIEAKMLMELDHSKIPNFANVNAEFTNPVYDPGRKYSMPYTWLVIGLGYRKSKMKGIVPDSWKYAFDSDVFKKRITVLGDSADLIRLTAKYLGYSLNDIPDEGLAKIEAVLTKQVKAGNILKFAGDEGDQMLADKEADLVVEYNGDIAQRMLVDNDIGFAIPKEGSELSSDTLAIPMGAPRPDNAHKFINYVLDAKAGAVIANTICYATPNDAAKALMPDTYKNNPVVYPPAADLAKCEYAQFPGIEKAQKFEEIATRVKAAASGG